MEKILKTVGKLIMVIVCAAVLLVAVGCVRNRGEVEGNESVELEVGDELPGFEVRMNDGGVVSDVDLRGKVSVVMFFHTTCPDCRVALPVVQRVYDEYSPKGVEFVLVSRGEGAYDVEAYWTGNGLGMAYSAQDDRTVYEKFAQKGIPRIYVNDRNGIIRYVFTDNPVPGYDELKAAVESMQTVVQ